MFEKWYDIQTMTWKSRRIKTNDQDYQNYLVFKEFLYPYMRKS